MKKESGITLVSLIITVIILSILTGVTLKTAINSNIFNVQNEIEDDLNKQIESNNKNVMSIKDKWDDVLNYKENIT